MDDAINKYFELNVKSLLVELGLENLPLEEKQKIAEMIEKNIMAKLQMHLMELLTDEESAKLDSAADHPEVLMEYFTTKKDVDFAALILGFSAEVREELLKDVAYMRGVMDGKE